MVTYNLPSVLIIEDDPSWRSFLVSRLNEKYQLEEASTPLEAISSIKRHENDPFDVIILDLVLQQNYSDKPTYDGIEVLEAIRKFNILSNVIILTGNPTTETAVITLEKDRGLVAYAYCIKNKTDPNWRRELLRKIESAVQDISRVRKQAVVFVSMPFRESFNEFYKNEIKPIIESFGKSCLRTDETLIPGSIVEQLFRQIKDSRYIVADLSKVNGEVNANVLFEIGFAHASRKPTILLTQDIDSVPYILKHYRTIDYDLTTKGLLHLRTELKGYIENFDMDESETSVFFPSISTATDSNKMSMQTIVFGLFGNQNEKVYSRVFKNIFKILEPKVLSWAYLGENYNPHNSSKTLDYTDSLLDTIIRAKLIFADLTFHNPTIMYLAGYATKLEKQIVYIAQNRNDIPFNIGNISPIIYDLNDADMIENVQKNISDIIKKVLDNTTI